MSIATTDVTPQHVYGKVQALDSNDYQSGVDAYYTPISLTWGFKMYQDVRKAYFTYFRQRILAMVGLAPQVGQQIPAIKVSEKRFAWERPMYGYIVESVRVQKWCQMPKRFKCNAEFYAEVTQLREKCDEALGVPTWDYNRGNIGFTDNDELLLIDCGDGDEPVSYEQLMDLKYQLKELGIWRGDDEEYLEWGEPKPDNW